MSTHQRKPVFAVVGTTGVGKSQLGIELAKAIGGEVINADSMQVYKGLDIATNKATMQERDGVPHHLMDFVEPSEEYSVIEFERDALRVIDEVHSRNRIPILVGGTNYYIQSVLWEQQIISSAAGSDPERVNPMAGDRDVIHPSLAAHPLRARIAEALAATQSGTRGPALNASADSVDLLGLLAEVDPGMADRWHAKDTRKIRRSLQVFYTTGKAHSTLLAEQKQSGEAGSHLRFDTCVFWIYSDPATLYPRLDARVDEMTKLGLFNELSEMRHRVRSGQVLGAPASGSADYTRGILQAIGFKEFSPYLTVLESPQPPSPDALEKLKLEGLELMKRATRQYAKRQVTWLRNKMAGAVLEETQGGSGEVRGRAAFYVLDASDIAKWTANVSTTALTIARTFLSPTTSNEQLPFPYTLTPLASQLFPPPPHPSPEHPTPNKPTWKKHTCPFCIDTQTGKPKVLNGEHEWRVHLGTRGHKMRMGGGESGRRGRRRESGGGDVSREEVAGRIDVE